ncbi:MAG: LPS assembly protein LptD [Gammaproteobacteria bacterium]
MKKSVLILLLCPAVFLTPVFIHAQEADNAWPLCTGSLDIPPRPVVTDILEPGDTHILADKVDFIENVSTHLEGDAEVTQDEKQTRADIIDYYQDSNTADLSGDVQFWDNDTYLNSPVAHIDFDADTAEFSQADYRLIANRGRGYADELFLKIGKTTQGKRVSFTTCDPEQEGDRWWNLTNNFWKISASEMTLDHEKERGNAKNVILRIKDIPVFYTPYMSFPLSDKRKSGFLVPTLGTSNNGGFDMQTPYYWNIAPEMDATLTPRYITDRGIMAMGEYRYLFDRGEGRINLEYLPGDSLFNDEDRNSISVEHDQRFLSSGRLSVDYNRVSDPQYLEDFGNNLSTNSARYLPQQADVRYSGRGWNLIGRVQGYQTINRDINVVSRPYKRLPQVLWRWRPYSGYNRLNVDVNTEVSYFTRSEDVNLPEDVTGFRFDLYPTISYPLRTQATFLTPKVGVRYTQYSLSDSTLFDDAPERVLPMFSLDSGIFLERNLSLFKTDYLQTLEPRLYYLYVPDEDQSDLPVFDAGVYSTSYNALFRDNRFSSADRFGDANQVTLAVTSRLIDDNSGREQAYIRIGQTFRLDKHDVVRQRLTTAGTLVNRDPVDDSQVSAIVMEAGTRLIDDWHLDAEVHWDPDDNLMEKAAIDARYRPGGGKVLNLGYRVRRRTSGDILFTTRDIEQTDVSFRWPINDQWSILGRWNYAIPEGRSLDLFGGIEYESCCWSTRFVARRFLANLNGDFQTGFFLQIQLKGLAGLGQQTVHFLRETIPGFRSHF